MLRRLAPLVAMMVGSACASIAGLDEYGPATTTTGTGGTAGTGGGAEGGEDGEGGDLGCPPDPSGWQGPVAVYQGDGPAPDCGVDGWTLAEEGGVAPMPGACTCECELVPVPQQAQYCSVAWTVQWSTVGACNSPSIGGGNLPANSCFNTTPPGEPIESVVATPSSSPNPGICQTAMPRVGATQYTETFRVCSFGAPPDDPVFCTRQVPEDYPTRLCVFKTGDVADRCPSGYPIRHTVVTDVTDASTCECACSLNEVHCRGLVDLHATTGCMDGAPQVVAADTTCQSVPTPTSFPSIEVRHAPAVGTCGTNKTVTPDITANDHTTLCCEQ
ncbi:MAG: hypothetical protein RIF41_07710 [Polyangiaceae bacterium]